MKTKRLTIGDPDSIKIRNDYEQKITLGKLGKIVKCPLCGAKNIGYFEYDRWNEKIGWNFDCKSTCLNSFEYSELSGFDDMKIWTDFKGKFIS